MSSLKIRATLADRYYRQAMELVENDEECSKILPLLDHAVKLNSRKSLYWQALLAVSSEEERYDLALKSIDMLAKFRKFPLCSINYLKLKLLYGLGHYRRALRILTHFHSVPDDTQVQLLIIKAKCYLHIGKYKKALALFKRVPAKNEAISCCQFYKGVCYFYLQKYCQAVQYFNEAAFHNSQRLNPDLLMMKGHSHYNLQEFERAVISYEEVLAINSSYTEIQFTLFLARLRLKGSGQGQTGK